MSRQTHAELIANLRNVANLTRFEPGSDKYNFTGDQIREATKLYRSSWLNPLIDELAKRLIRPKRKKA